MLLSLWPNWWDDWEAQWACTFDGQAKTITVNPTYANISVKADIYSAWKQWFSLRDNSKFAPAVRVIGGDPTAGGQLAGDIYFLINDWQVIIKHRVVVNGVLYHDNPLLDPYVVKDGGGVISTVSSLVQTAETTIPVAAEQLSSEEIAAAVWANADALRPKDISDEVWNDVKALTVAKFIGLS